jgi:hypothetical protein
MKQERWNRWRCLIRNPQFQAAVNQLRAEFRTWAIGPPLCVGLWDGEYLVETELARKDIDRHGQAMDHRDDSFLQAWGRFEYTWQITLPKKALTDRLPSLSYLTVDDWQRLWAECETIIPPALTLIEAGLVNTPPGTLTIQLDLGHVDGDLLECVKEALRKARAGMPKSRRTAEKKGRTHQDKFTDQLRVFDAGSLGASVWEIAKTEGKPQSTVKSMLKAIRKRIGSEKPHHGRAWYAHHVKICPICHQIGIPSNTCPSVAERRKREGQVHEARIREFQRTYIPPLLVSSEKAAFGRWDAQHPDYNSC